MLMAGRKQKNKFKKYLELCRELLSSLLFPRRCPVCDDLLSPEESKNGIHVACKSRLYPILGAVCMHCGRPLGDENSNDEESKYQNVREYCYDCMAKGYHRRSNITQAKALYRYKGAIKTSMYRFKYSNKREYAVFFAQEAAALYGQWIRQKAVDVIIPVPMYQKKQKRRGYNQAETFAKELSKQIGIPMRRDMIQRVIDTAPQKELGALQRKNNLKKAFHTGKNVVQYSCAMVVDDIYTTGSTAEAVAQELIKQGTHRVCLLTICIGGDM